MPIENLLNKDQCEMILIGIMGFFDDHSKGDPYGWDWPTMRVLWPNKCRVFKRVQKVYRRLIFAKDICDYAEGR